MLNLLEGVFPVGRGGRGGRISGAGAGGLGRGREMMVARRGGGALEA